MSTYLIKYSNSIGEITNYISETNLDQKSIAVETISYYKLSSFKDISIVSFFNGI